MTNISDDITILIFFRRGRGGVKGVFFYREREREKKTNGIHDEFYT